MKLAEVLQPLTEAKFAKQKIYGFHGTHSGNLRSIIKKGLVAQHQGGWGSHMTTGYGYDLSAVGGVYFILDYDRSLFIARTVSDGYSNKTRRDVSPIIVVAKIQPKAIVMDEDRLQETLSIPHHVQILEEMEERGDIMIDGYVENNMNHIENLLRVAGLKYDSIEKILPILRERYIEYFTDIYTLVEIKMVMEEKIERDLPDRYFNKDYRQELIDSIKDQQKQLRELLKGYWQKALDDAGIVEDRDTVFAIEDNVGFSGSNKIVGIIHPEKKMYWGDVGTDRQQMKKAGFETEWSIPDMSEYTKVKTPMELLEDDREE